MKWSRTAAAEWGCIVSGCIAVGSFVVWLFGVKPSPSLAAPMIAIIAALTCGYLFYLGKRIESKTATEKKAPVSEFPQDGTDWHRLYLEADKDRAECRKKYAEIANKNSELQSALSQSPTPRTKLISLCDDLRCFSARYGPIQVVERKAHEELDDYIQRKWHEEDIWKSKMAADFRLNFAVRVKTMRDEIEVGYHQTSSNLDMAVESAQTPLCDPKTVEQVRSELWLFGLVM